MTMLSGQTIRLAACLMAMFAVISHAEEPNLLLRPSASRLIRAGSPYQTYRVELPTAEGKARWIRGIEFHPGEPEVIRSAFFYVDKTGQWLGGWNPGAGVIEFPESVAAHLPAGAKIILEIHYQSIDRDVQDSSSLSLHFTDRKPLRPLTAMGVETRIQVPAGGQSFQLQKEFTVISDSYALALRPEMQAAGRSMEITALDPSGTSQTLLSATAFSQNPRGPYIFSEPVFMPKGTRIVAMASYQNPDPRITDDLFKLTMSLYPSAEFKAADPRPVVRRPARKSSVRRPPARRTPARK